MRQVHDLFNAVLLCKALRYRKKRFKVLLVFVFFFLFCLVLFYIVLFFIVSPALHNIIVTILLHYPGCTHVFGPNIRLVLHTDPRYT